MKILPVLFEEREIRYEIWQKNGRSEKWNSMSLFMKIVLLVVGVCGVIFIGPYRSLWAENGEDLRTIEVKVTHIKHREIITDTEYIAEASPNIIAKVVREGLNDWGGFVPGYPYSQIIGNQNVSRILGARPKTFKEVLQLLSNETEAVEERMIHTSDHETTFFVLTQVQLPWPISKRWSLAKVVYQQNSFGDSFTEQYEMIAGDCTKGGGQWKVKADRAHPGRSLVFNQHSLDCGVQVPTFVATLFSKKIARNVHEVLRERFEMLAKNNPAN